MSDLEKIAKDYAENRMATKRLNKKARLFFEDEGIPTPNLNDFRQSYYDTGCSVSWKGWVYCLNASEMEFTHADMELAVILDQKAALRVELGKIRRRLFSAGKKLLKAAE